MTPSERDRFWAKVDTSGDCWLWTACTLVKGYGRLNVNGVARLAHQLAYEDAIGPIPPGMQIDHICHAPGCVRVDHMQLASNQKNGENRSGPYRNTSSGLRGVHRHKRGWKVLVRAKGVSYYGGVFRTKEEAAPVAIALRNRVMTNNLLDRTKESH